MNIVYKTGDLFSSDEKVLVHGCNARGAYGSGVAGIMRKNYPEAYESYMRFFKSGSAKLGAINWVNVFDGRLIGNAITQDRYGNDPNIVYADYYAIRLAMKEINTRALNDGFKSVGMPLIGAGLAHGSWKKISQIIQEEAIDFSPIVYLLDGKIPIG